VRWNTFHGNKGHNDVLDVDSDVLPNPILQLRENIFLGQSGDEDCDLGGDVFIDGNFFAHGHKDTANTSLGHASAFSTGDAGTGTTVGLLAPTFSGTSITRRRSRRARPRSSNTIPITRCTRISPT